jgi:hypothetical protein
MMGLRDDAPRRPILKKRPACDPGRLPEYPSARAFGEIVFQAARRTSGQQAAALSARARKFAKQIATSSAARPIPFAAKSHTIYQTSERHMQDTTGISPYPGTTGNTQPSGSPSIPSTGGASSSSTIGEQAKDAASEAAGQASSLVDQAREKASAAAEGQKAGLADQIDGFADAVHKSGEQFKGQQDWIASAVERGATELSSLASSLRDNDLGTLLKQVQSFARQQPALFIGASFAAGFALSRFGKIVAADISSDDLPTMPEISRGER